MNPYEAYRRMLHEGVPLLALVPNRREYARLRQEMISLGLPTRRLVTARTREILEVAKRHPTAVSAARELGVTPSRVRNILRKEQKK